VHAPPEDIWRPMMSRCGRRPLRTGEPPPRGMSCRPIRRVRRRDGPRSGRLSGSSGGRISRSGNGSGRRRARSP